MEISFPGDDQKKVMSDVFMCADKSKAYEYKNV